MDKYSQNLMIKVSELYYIHEMTQQQIANRLRISRVKVSRILTSAKKRRIIEININYPIDNCVKLERKFEKLFNLKEALIISNKYKSREIIYNEVKIFKDGFIKWFPRRMTESSRKMLSKRCINPDQNINTNQIPK